jgi:glucosamine--fructose-6-phosphate aminotransferase (isomerizing)
VIPHLITGYLEKGLSPEEAVAATVKELHGSFALAILFAGRSQFLIAARRGSPLAIGFAEQGVYLGSDAYALSPYATQVMYLEDGDFARLSAEGVAVFDEQMRRVERAVRTFERAAAAVGKGEYRHYMLKEIHEQPMVAADTLAAYFDPVTGQFQLPRFPFDPKELSHITIVACGTSFYAGMVAKYWLEKIAGIPVSLDIASEFRYREAPLPAKGLALFISQSGETADTLAALKFAKAAGQHIVSLVNVTTSSMALASDVILPTLAGPEIGVASTKAFTTQLVVLACLTLSLAEARDKLAADEREKVVSGMMELPALVRQALSGEERLKELAAEMKDAKNAIYIGRGTSYAVALEGALKLKELTYVHAEGIAAGELKHGPIALIDPGVPVVALAPSDSLFEKTFSNIQEVAARGGRVLALTDAKGAASLSTVAEHVIVLPESHPMLNPMLYTVPLQLLAYYAALARGNDVDQPRNLAKSVTVE